MLERGVVIVGKGGSNCWKPYDNTLKHCTLQGQKKPIIYYNILYRIFIIVKLASFNGWQLSLKVRKEYRTNANHY